MLSHQSFAFECCPALCRPGDSNQNMTLFAGKDRGLIRDNRASSPESKDSHMDITRSHALCDL